MLNALAVLLDGGNQPGWLRAARSMEQQGFTPASDFDWDKGGLRTWAHPTQRSVENCEIRTATGVACCIGPVWYRGRFDIAALRALLDDINATGRIDEMELRGNFALFMRTQERCLLMNDVLGFVRLYVSPDGYFYSSSWLATCAYVGAVELDEAAAAEYVLLGASHSERTVAHGIKTLRMAHAFDLTLRCEQGRLSDDNWREARGSASFEGAVEQICGHLRTVCDEITAAFPGRTRTALSGGFDSRLILAGLLASGNRPDLFVYGDSNSDDVRIAHLVADSAGIPLDVIDKNLRDGSAVPTNLDQLLHSALFFDGLPNDGIYDTGADEHTRLDQNADGRIALNGGGGEIFRNFFHLPDRAFHPLDIVRTFYRGFDPKVFRRPGGLSSYEGNLVSSITHSLDVADGATGQPLRREQVELLYPLFRCHHWMSVNNSVATRHGYYATPLMDLTTVTLAWQLPLAWKNAGKLESRLVEELDLTVARQPSAYGFRFSKGPSRRAQFSEWIHSMRPVRSRPLINATRRRLHGLGVGAEMIVHGRSLLPGEWRLDRMLDLSRLPSNLAFARAIAVEVAWRKLVG